MSAADAAGHLAIGVDIGGTRIKLGVVDATGALLASALVPTPHEPEHLATAVAAQVAHLREQVPAAVGAPVGVAAPGIIDETAGTVVAAVNLGWQDVPIRALLIDALGVPVALGHDVRAGALAESRWGAGRALGARSGADGADLLFVPLGTGIAAAWVRDGRVQGDRFTGEIGQVRVRDPLTGSTDRLERVAAASAIGRRYAEARADGTAVPTDVVVDRARTGDELAERIVFSALDTLAQALATVISSTGPIPIVIGGGLADGGALVLDALTESLGFHLGVIPSPPVLAAALGSWAGCRGAALLALDAAAGGA